MRHFLRLVRKIEGKIGVFEVVSEVHRPDSNERKIFESVPSMEQRFGPGRPVSSVGLSISVLVHYSVKVNTSNCLSSSAT